MAIPINPVVAAIPPSGIRRFFDIAAQDKSVISLSVGEPNFSAPDKVRAAMIQSLEEGKTQYTSNTGMIELRREIATWLNKKYGVQYNGDSEILITVGVSEAYDICMRGCLSPGDEVIIPKPCFVMYEPLVAFTGAKPVAINTRAENGFVLTADELEKAITPKTKMLVLNYPNNPTGATFTRNQLLAIAKIVEKHNLTVASDEVYSELSYEIPHTCFAALPGMKERTLLLSGFSKFFAMTGIRMGFVCCPAEALKQIAKVHQFGIMCAPTQSQIGALVALKECEADIQRMKVAYKERRDLLVKELRAMGFDCPNPGGAFYLYPSVKPFGMEGEPFCYDLLEKGKLAVVPGNAFGSAYSDRIRISYGAGMDVIKESLKRMKVYIDGLKVKK